MEFETARERVREVVAQEPLPLLHYALPPPPLPPDVDKYEHGVTQGVPDGPASTATACSVPRRVG